MAVKPRRTSPSGTREPREKVVLPRLPPPPAYFQGLFFSFSSPRRSCRGSHRAGSLAAVPAPPASSRLGAKHRGGWGTHRQPMGTSTAVPGEGAESPSPRLGTGSSADEQRPLPARCGSRVEPSGARREKPCAIPRRALLLPLLGTEQEGAKRVKMSHFLGSGALLWRPEPSPELGMGQRLPRVACALR